MSIHPRCWLLLASGAALPSVQPLVAQAPTVVLRADSAFQRQDWQAAAGLYRAAVQHDSLNGLLWLRLGTVEEQLHDFAGAVPAYRHALPLLSANALPVELRLSRAFAQLQQPDSALAHLRAAAAVGFAPVLADNEPGLDPIRSRPEYATILKSAEAARYPCTGVHTFDYWEGTWGLSAWSQPGSKPGGIAHNTRRYNGCVFVEEFAGNAPGAGAGMSMVFYDTTLQRWRMFWDDDRNGSNVFDGEFRDGAMHFLGWVNDARGQRVMASNTIARIAPDTLRQTYAISADSGRTWTAQGDNRWVRQKSQ